MQAGDFTEEEWSQAQRIVANTTISPELRVHFDTVQFQPSRMATSRALYLVCMCDGGEDYRLACACWEQLMRTVYPSALH